MSPTGHWPSDWPAECGDTQRSKVAPGPGLALVPTDRLVTTARHTGRRPIMFVQRGRGELYLFGTGSGRAQATGWVERVDPVTLEPVAGSGDLPGGGHPGIGSLAAHANGDLYGVNGSRLLRLDPDCRVVGALALPVGRPHNGLAILSDGMIAVKDVGRAGEASTLTIVGPDLEIRVSARLDEPSAGRIATAVEGGGSGGGGADLIFVAGTTSVVRLRWDGSTLAEDRAWRPRYRHPQRGGPAAGLTVTDDRVWLMDNGRASDDDLDTEPPWPDPVRLLGFDAGGIDGGEPTVLTPTELPAGWVLAAPVVHRGVAVGWDTGNTGLAAFDVSPGAGAEMLWYQPFRSSMRPLLFPASAELVVNDFRYLEDGTTSDDIVVLDLATGRMKARAATGAVRHGGMFLTPGWKRDLYYCSDGTVARIRVEPMEPGATGRR